MKSILASKTFWGAIGGLIVSLFAIFDIQIASDEAQTIGEAIGAIVSAALVIYGRVSAQKRVTLGKPGTLECIIALSFFVPASLMLGGCNSLVQQNGPVDPAQVAKLSAISRTIMQIGTASAVAKDPSIKEPLLAVAEVIEQAAAKPDAPQPSAVLNLASAAASKFGGPYGALAGLALQGGFSIYQQLYAANASTALDKQPAFKAVLLSLADGIRAGVASTEIPVASPPDLKPEDFVLRSAN